MTDAISVPEELAATLEMFFDAKGVTFAAALPDLATTFLNRWGLRLDGPAMHGMCALVLPVVRTADDTPAVLKLQILDAESEGEPVALRVWDGDGAVRLLAHDGETGTMLLERLDPARMLSHEPDTRKAVLVIARLLAHLTTTPAPPAMRRLSDIATDMLDRTPPVLARIPDTSDRRLIADCAAALREVVSEPGDRLLHWDLHFDNVLGADRAPWLAIDPKPLAGDPAFELWPALNNRFDPNEVPWRFDAMTDVLALDRDRARAWTLARLLQNAIWEIEEGRPLDPDDLELARRLR
ncbi:aminoglycoside phosphotransferase family protein [Streptomyces europaeiscabiei]|uniref:Aminoglycoside phosphotransferase family protein n=1 Tax=Streptomyces europaeiscabiei TaxID=146819 RepID=A0ABU4NJE4_9ACTN|nr:aminoglycoside phosphotransferase family protein [Streptomyces europaeiscabiei]MDX2770560.1 aminoglycoside phosphotransferase family protein [Streptomyces europaeiscabiei]MDX3544650.1 aminoglycoside phosphotransferase family protein [Streptomyces europaeiscabiei]MDX3554000.1 aminoglycoside phosphotransferase family protein [Streptomyces europaeiscabiei]MDX3702118.1 aminoglycoside phosphotransferase family protein [Streptomyces europaeiscabiei]